MQNIVAITIAALFGILIITLAFFAGAVTMFQP